ncbi:hypothetical protein Mgra_00010012 [Meloidogyne graminicola]|uniref:Uncharacterized protein n=1 Tax=Meloidogyne graminicola TaxID=189291 RepID=A0A8S9Z8M3_9BILA|nr:hypothetical protein Mgra_00010012 [Meloidogyne graminicola]
MKLLKDKRVKKQEGMKTLRINERENITLKHTVERSQSQISRSPAGVLSPWMGGHGRSNSRHSHSGGNNNNHRSSADQLTENKNKNFNSTNSIPQLTIVLMGAPKTGKSALVSQFLWECFLSEYRPTVEEFNWVEYGCKDQKNGPNFILQIIDSSGSRDFLAMRHLYYRIADAFMVVYAADDPQSYTEALTMLKEIEEQNTKKAPIILLQNKSDLVPRNGGGNTPPSPALLPDEEKDKQLLITSVRRMRASAKNLEQGKRCFSWLIEELVRHSENILSETQNDGKRRPTIISAENNMIGNKGRRRNGSGPTTGFLPSNTGKVALLTRRRQSMPSRRTASELGIDEHSLRQFMKRYENQKGRNVVGCCIQ